MTTYELCRKLASRGKLTKEMLDVFFAAGRLMAGQYEELIALLG